jgi:hypothetical protein
MNDFGNTGRGALSFLPLNREREGKSMARVWFTAENTSDLTKEDLSILNRAARVVVGQSGDPDFSTLCKLRNKYKTGMSAAELSDLVGDQ